MPRDGSADPYRNFMFEVGGIEVAAFSDVSGFDVSVNMAEYRDGNEATRTTRKLPGLAKYGNITLKRGVISDLKIYEWIINIAKDGKVDRKDVTLSLKDIDAKVVAVWQVINAWPVKYSVSEFKGQGNDIVMETLELAHEGMTRTQ